VLADEVCTQLESREGFWPVIFQLAMRGRLDLVSLALQRHSQIALTLAAPAGRNTFLDRTHCEALLDLLHTHPLVTVLQQFRREQELPPTGRELPLPDSRALAIWQSHVAALRESTLALRLPELDTLILILLGDVDTLKVLSSHEWTLFVLSRLLFQFSVAMPRANLCRVAEESIALLDNDRWALSLLRTLTYSLVMLLISFLLLDLFVVMINV
jgi:hypothetical protein